jgi:hypothetical protein
MGFLDFIIRTDRNDCDQFKSDILELLEFFDSIKPYIQKCITEYKNRNPGCAWNDKELKYNINVLSFGFPPKSLDDAIFSLLDQFIRENIEIWIQKFSQKDWFEYNKDSIYPARTICIFLAKILIATYSTENFQIILDKELDSLFEIKAATIKRVKRVIIQNLVIEKDQEFNFKDESLTVKGREERWHEGEIAKSCKVNDFHLKFQFHLRRISSEEYEIFSHSRGFIADQMNVSTILEIIYEFPNDRFASTLSELAFKSHLATHEIAGYFDEIIRKLTIAIKFSTGKFVFPVAFESNPQNY